MSRRYYFISHPNVVIDPTVPVPEWPLSELGRNRMKLGLQQSWINAITSIYSSTEQKATDAAEILAKYLDLQFTQVHELGENDRSATGFLSPEEFERVANEFFAKPDQSVRGWERAIDAQKRIVAAVQSIAMADNTAGSIAIVSHGAVGTLLYCHLAGQSISRERDQPPNGGGNFYPFSVSPPQADQWLAIDGSAA